MTCPKVCNPRLTRVPWLFMRIFNIFEKRDGFIHMTSHDTRSNEIGLVQTRKITTILFKACRNPGLKLAVPPTQSGCVVLDFLCEPLRLDGAFVTGHMAFGICRERAPCFRVLHWILYGIEYLKTSSNWSFTRLFNVSNRPKQFGIVFGRRRNETYMLTIKTM